MSDELKACPFCGGSRLYTEDRTTAWCSDCDEGWVTCPGDPVDAFTRWNTRPLESALQFKLSIAVEALEKMTCSCSDSGYPEPYCNADIARDALEEIKRPGADL